MSIINPQKAERKTLYQEKGGNEQRALTEVLQDRSTAARGRAASPEPAAPEKLARSQGINTQMQSSRKSSSKKRRSDPITMHAEPILKAKLRDIARGNSLSISQTALLYCKRGMQQEFDLKYSEMFIPAMEAVINKNMKSVYRDGILVESLYFGFQALCHRFERPQANLLVLSFLKKQLQAPGQRL